MRAALATLYLLVLVPITIETERVLPPDELPELRRAVNDALVDLVYADPLHQCGTVPVLELTDPVTGRLDTVLAALHTNQHNRALDPPTSTPDMTADATPHTGVY